MRSYEGTTLVELMIVIVIVGIMAGVSAFALRPVPSPSEEETAIARLQQLRRSAIANGRALDTTIELSGKAYAVSAYPDGRVRTVGLLPVDPLSGQRVNAGR